MPQTRSRVVGSGFTSLNYRGQPIAFMDSFTDSGQEALATQAPQEGVFVLGERHAVELGRASCRERV